MTRWTDESSDACERCPVTGHLSQASKDTPDVTSGGRLFQTWGPATGKALSPTVDMQVRLWLDGGPYVSTATLNYNGCAAECAANVGWSARRTNGLSVVSRRPTADAVTGIDRKAGSRRKAFTCHLSQTATDTATSDEETAPKLLNGICSFNDLE